MPASQLVILSRNSGKPGELAAIGSRREVLRALEGRNTWPERPGEDVLYGPGIEIQLAPEQDPITQMLLTITDEDIAWAVVMRLAKDLEWKLFDPYSGRELTP